MRTSIVVIPAMLCELVTGFFLLLFPVNQVPIDWAYVNVIMLAGIWMSTFFLQVPCHTKLTTGFNLDTCNRLVSGNWIRTLLWSVRSITLLYLLTNGSQS
ncbi:hypothetical protein [Polystyrenella longa]|nr:hypothetical protein [Polystyrenella longa]